MHVLARLVEDSDLDKVTQYIAGHRRTLLRDHQCDTMVCTLLVEAVKVPVLVKTHRNIYDSGLVYRHLCRL